MHNFLCKNVEIFTNYILPGGRINKFWCGGISSIGIFNFGTKCLKNQTIKILNYIKSLFAKLF